MTVSAGAIRRVRPPVVALAFGSLLSTGALIAAPQASADLLDDGQWWRTAMGVAELQARGAGQGVTVALIDGPIDSTVPELQGHVASSTTECLTPDGRARKASAPGHDAQHATMMASLLIGSGKGTATGGRGVAGIAPRATLRHYAVAFAGPASAPQKLQCHLKGGASNDVDKATARAIRQAVKDGAKIISISLTTGYTIDYVPALLEAYKAGAIVVASTNNDRRNVFWPAIGNGVATVTHVDAKGNLDNSATRGSSLVDFTAPGTKIAAGGWFSSGWRSDAVSDGSSQATAITAGGLAAVWSAHPEATGNQVLQAAKEAVGVRAEKGTFLTWFRRVGTGLPKTAGKTKSYGFGIFSPADAVRLDVEQLPDTNPLVTDRPVDEPTAAEIAQATAPPFAPKNATTSSTSSSSATTTPDVARGAAKEQKTTDSSRSMLPWLGAGLLALLLGVAFFVQRRRSSRLDSHAHDPKAAADGAAATTKENTHA